MNRVEISVDGVDEPAWMGRLEDFALKVLAHLGKDAWDLSILLCGDAVMKDLNSRYRKKDESTDVLSFELGESYEDEEAGKRWGAGDIAISLDTLKTNAAYFSVSEDEELRRLVVHGILHLSGLDHEDNDASRPMLVQQEKIMAELSGLSVLGASA